MYSLPIELIYKIIEYTKYPLLYFKYLFPKNIIPYKYKLDYITSIEDSLLFPGTCHYNMSRIGKELDFSVFIQPITGFFEKIYKKDRMLIYHLKFIYIFECYSCKAEHLQILNDNYCDNSILYEICKNDKPIFWEDWNELKTKIISDVLI